jgi:hypothetical protein
MYLYFEGADAIIRVRTRVPRREIKKLISYLHYSIWKRQLLSLLFVAFIKSKVSSCYLSPLSFLQMPLPMEYHVVPRSGNVIGKLETVKGKSIQILSVNYLQKLSQIRIQQVGRCKAPSTGICSKSLGTISSTFSLASCLFMFIPFMLSFPNPNLWSPWVEIDS